MPVNEVNRIMAPMDFDDAVRSSPHPTGVYLMGSRPGVASRPNIICLLAAAKLKLAAGSTLWCLISRLLQRRPPMPRTYYRNTKIN
jgi:hypothetical protein